MGWQIAVAIGFMVVASVGLFELATGRGFPWQRRFHGGPGRRAVLNRVWGLATALVGSVFGVNALLEFTGRHAPEWFRLFQISAQLVFLAMLLGVMGSAIQQYFPSDQQRLPMSDTGSLLRSGWRGTGPRRNLFLWISFAAVVLTSLGFYAMWNWLGR
jgi:hypothetical protein